VVYVDRIELTFDAAHRLPGYPGKCAAPHGHSFRAEVFVAARDLDASGFVIDFRDLKGRLKTWIDAHWDHAFFVAESDGALLAALRTLPESRVYVFPGSPTTELVARELFEEARRQLGPLVRSVRVWESPTQWAEYLPDPPPETNGHAPARWDERAEGDTAQGWGTTPGSREIRTG
jgi:6-pyruvoyltetrahydropterin/6-carboxytetrahydropterin synthase